MAKTPLHIVVGLAGLLLCWSGAHAAPDGDQSRARLDTALDFSDGVLLGMLQDEPDAEGAADAASNESKWQFELAPFVWAPSLDADIIVKGAKFRVDMDFSDIFDDLDMAAMGQVRGTRDKWMFQVNGMYVALAIDGGIKRAGDAQALFAFAGDIQEQELRRIIEIPVGIDVAVGIAADFIADVSVNLDLTIVELFAGYELLSFPLEGIGNPHNQRDASVRITPYGGARLTAVDIETNVWLSASADVNVDVDVQLGNNNVDPNVAAGATGNAQFEFDADDVWVDPVIGLDVAIVDLDRWNISGRGDIGGFGIGSASSLVWSVGGRVTYQVNPKFSVWGGYFLIDYDYSKGSGSGEFGLNGRFEGPMLGGSFTF